LPVDKCHFYRRGTCASIEEGHRAPQAHIEGRGTGTLKKGAGTLLEEGGVAFLIGHTTCRKRELIALL